MEDFKTFTANSVKMAKDTYIKDPKLDGVILVFCEAANREENAMWALKAQDDKQKEVLFGSVSIAMQNRDVQRYCVMTLAWMTQMDPRKDKFIMPSKSPSRKEALVVNVKAKDGTYMMSVFDVFRGPTNKITGFGAPMDMTENASGRILELFEVNPKIPTHVRTLADLYMDTMLVHGKSIKELRGDSKTPGPH